MAHGINADDRGVVVAVPRWQRDEAVEMELGTTKIIVSDTRMRELYQQIAKLAASRISVLITGETGSGKESAAEALHYWSSRSDGPFVSLNCSAIPDSLAESELFGHERGAFTDARLARQGLLEAANGGTLFLDEVADLSLATQAKLLRAVETRRITRVGDTREREIDVRIIAAANADLAAAVAEKRFRQDLLYRIGAASIHVPPLRERPSEIALLARRFVVDECRRLGRETLPFSEEALEVLCTARFPGNVRELKNAVAYAVAIAEGTRILARDLPALERDARDPVLPHRSFRPLADELRALEKRRMIEALAAFDGIQTRAAAALAMPLRTFTLRLRQHGIDPRAGR